MFLFCFSIKENNVEKILSEKIREKPVRPRRPVLAALFFFLRVKTMSVKWWRKTARVLFYFCFSFFLTIIWLFSRPPSIIIDRGNKIPTSRGVSERAMGKNEERAEYFISFVSVNKIVEITIIIVLLFFLHISYAPLFLLSMSAALTAVLFAYLLMTTRGEKNNQRVCRFPSSSSTILRLFFWRSICYYHFSFLTASVVLCFVFGIHGSDSRPQWLRSLLWWNEKGTTGERTSCRVLFSYWLVCHTSPFILLNNWPFLYGDRLQSFINGSSLIWAYQCWAIELIFKWFISIFIFEK